MRTLRQTIEGMALVFDAEGAPELDAVLQFEVTGPQPGAYHLRIKDRGCTFHLGRAANQPSLTITTPSDVWLRIGSGELSGREALLDGLYQATGDLDLLMSLDRLFRPRAEVALVSTARPPGPIPLGGMAWLALAFMPWLAIWLGLSWGTAILGAVAIAAYRMAVRELTWFEASTVLSLGVLGLAALRAGDWTARWGTATATLLLAILWLAPTLVRAPALSAAYSKWKYIPALWRNTTFLHVNAVISLAWGWTFIGQGLLAVGAGLTPDRAPLLASLRWVLLGFPLWLTLRLPRNAPDRSIPDLDRAPLRLQLIALAGLVTALAAIFMVLR